MTGYSIEARAYDIVGVASHDFSVLRDPSGKAVAELHGLSTDREAGVALAIGTDEERHSLRAWHLAHDRAMASELGERVADRSFIGGQQARQTIFTGSRDEAFARWKAAVNAIPTLNALDRDYPSWGFKLDGSTVNSNSTYRTLG